MLRFIECNYSKQEICWGLRSLVSSFLFVYVEQPRTRCAKDFWAAVFILVPGCNSHAHSGVLTGLLCVAAYVTWYSMRTTST